MPIARLGLMRRPRWLCSKARELKGWGERFTTDWLQREVIHESRLHHPYMTLHHSTWAWTHVE
jgi:hypothetical protein